MWTTALQEDLVDSLAWAGVSGAGLVAPAARASSARLSEPSAGAELTPAMPAVAASRTSALTPTAAQPSRERLAGRHSPERRRLTKRPRAPWRIGSSR